MATLQERLEEIMRAKSWDRRDLIRISRQSSSVVSQWLGNGSKLIKTISKVSVALALQRESGFSAEWIAEGTGPKFAESSAQCDQVMSDVPSSSSNVARLETKPMNIRIALVALATALDNRPIEEAERLGRLLNALALSQSERLVEQIASIIESAPPQAGEMQRADFPISQRATNQKA